MIPRAAASDGVAKPNTIDPSTAPQNVTVNARVTSPTSQNISPLMTSEKSPNGASRTKVTTPVFAAEWVTASVSSGYAIVVNDDPALDSSCPVCSRTKSRLRQSGLRRAAGSR